MSSKVFVLVIFSLIFKINCNNHPNSKLVNFSLVSPKGQGQKNEYHIQTNALIVLECLAKFPIKIVFSGIMAHEIKYTKIEWDKTTGFYNVTIGFDNIPQATGAYSCVPVGRSVNDGTSSSTIYIFADNGTEPFLLNWKKNKKDNATVKVSEIEKQVLIPCITFRPNVQLILSGKKDNSTNSNFSVLRDKMFRYDNQKGFFVDGFANSTNTIYQCAISNSSISPKLEFKMKEINCIFAPTDSMNEYNEIHWSTHITISIKCQSIYEINIRKNSQETIGHSKPYNHYHYKYIVNVDLKSLNVGDIITCDKMNGETIRKWWLVKKPVHQQTIKFSKLKKIFYCSGNETEYEITMAQINCHNLANCETARRFDPINAINIPENHYPYSLDDDSNIAGPTTKLVLGIPKKDICAFLNLRENVTLGIVYCIFKKIYPEKSKKMVSATLQYFVDLNNQIVEETNYGNLTNVLRMPLYNDTKNVFVGVSVNFVCEASVFIFAKGMEFYFVLRNGSRLNITEDSRLTIEEYVSSSKITLTGNITIPNKDVTAIACSAKMWNETKSMEVTQKIKVMVGNGTKPWISVDNFPSTSGQEVEIEFFINDESKNVSCTATGYPPPNICWERLDWESHKLKNLFENSTATSKNTTISTLILPSHSREAYYKYVCIATNDDGVARKAFVIKISKRGIPHWIIYTISATLVLVLLATVLFLCKMLRVKQIQIELTEAEILNFMNGDEDLVKKYQELHEVARYLPYKQHYEIHPSKIEFKNDVLGTGSFGMVLKGTMEKSGKKIPVAVKTVKSGADIDHLRTLLSEIKIMMYIGNHPHIIEMLGAMTTDLREGKLFVAVEYCSNGNLQSYLRLCRPNFVDQVVDDEISTKKTSDTVKGTRGKSTRRFPGKSFKERRNKNIAILPQLKTTNLITWCYQVASGMEYLDTKKVIHGDLAARNLLLTEALSVKITDFGLARHLYDYTNYVTKQKNEPLPWRWLSIEAIKDSKFSTKSDVWAYGVTLWEIFSLGGIPYQGFSWGEEFVRSLSGGYRMGKAQYATDDIHNTMLECWNTSAADRPSFEDISTNFKELMERIGVWTENNMVVANNVEDFSPFRSDSEIETIDEHQQYIN